MSTFTPRKSENYMRRQWNRVPSIGVHTYSGGDQYSTHSANVDYTSLLPELFTLHAGKFYIHLASQKDWRQVLTLIKCPCPGIHWLIKTLRE
jgi:hypothetical protein